MSTKQSSLKRRRKNRLISPIMECFLTCFRLILLKMVGVSVRKKSLEENEEPEVGEMIVTKDYISAGNLIGEMAMLTSARRNSSCTCESEVQVSNILSYLSFACSLI